MFRITLYLHQLRLAKRVVLATLSLGFATAGMAQVSHAKTAEKLYRNYCSSCHGAQMQGAMGPSLVDEQWLHGSSNEEIAAVINNGVPKKGMPAWKKSLSPADVRALVILIREHGYEHAAAAQPDASDGLHTAAGHSFTLRKVASLPGQIWSMDFMPDGNIIASQRDGKLWLIQDGKVGQPIKGTPKVWHEGQGGLLEVALHPEYERNGWVYLTLSDPAGKNAMTKVVRGKLRDAQWVEQEDVFVAPKQFYTQAGVHFGSRLVFVGDYLYFTVGDRGQRELAQDLAFPFGKIHRVKHDGSIPEDNPFVKQKQALPSIWSYGHRNPQGLAVHPVTGDLWAAEHGPRGGDEVNRIVKGSNYGWPVISYGMNYDGSAMVDKTLEEGMEQPEHYWVPSIAVSEVDFYTGGAFAQWKNRMLVGSLAKQELRLLTIDGQTVTYDHLLFKNLGRIRDVANGPDGYPYVVLNNEHGTIYRLEPTKETANHKRPTI